MVDRKTAAKELGISVQRIAVLIKQGRIPETDAGIDLEKAKRLKKANTDPARLAAYQQRKAAETARPKRAYAVRGAVKVEDTETGELFNYSKARARREHHNAELAALKYREQSGLLVGLAAVNSVEFEVARMLRDRILGLPARLASYVPPAAMQTIVDECEALVRDLQTEAARIAGKARGDSI